MNGDSPELEALFDSIAQPPLPPAPAVETSGDSPELEALFDSIASEASRQPRPESADEAPAVESLLDGIAAAIEREEAPAEASVCSEHVFTRLGQLTRSLHNLLRELGYDKAIEQAAIEIPDSRDRLKYIATMTEQAAERTLNAAEAAQPIQERLGSQAQVLADGWERMFRKELGVDEFKSLVRDTRNYLHEVPEATAATNAQLMEIILAQDFQDLTGQVIKKILDAIQVLESQLIGLLVETTPVEKRNAVRPGLLEGPVIGSGRTDVVTSQEQVDELLESLGF